MSRLALQSITIYKFIGHEITIGRGKQTRDPDKNMTNMGIIRKMAIYVRIGHTNVFKEEGFPSVRYFVSYIRRRDTYNVEKVHISILSISLRDKIPNADYKNNRCYIFDKKT